MIKLSLFKIKNKLKIIWIIINHLKNLSLVKGNKKQILIICDGIISHGGLVDRLKGIISFYQIAKLKDFDFKIQFNNPFRLTEFLVPNSYNWSTTIVDLKWNPLNTSFLLLMDNFEFDPIASFTKSKKYNFIIYCNVDYLSKIHLDKSKIEVAQIWQNSYRELFTPSKYFKEKLEEVKIESKRIAVHTRFTGLMGDFKDSSNKTISNERKTEILKLLMTEINKISKIIKIKYKKIDALINNASNNPTPGKNKNIFENFLENSWDEDLNVGLKGSFLCTKIFGRIMKYNSSLTSIINISSDLGIVAPDQSIYENGYKKPVTYSVIKHGIIGLTKYTASYWANQNIRCNTIAPGPIDGNQKSNLKKKLIKKIPSGRLATREDITNTILFLISKKSSYINGATIIIDGGKTII